MLCLTRHEGEVIVINGDIRITVLKAEKGKVRIGIEAPKAVPVHRLEVFNKIERGERKQMKSV